MRKSFFVFAIAVVVISGCSKNSSTAPTANQLGTKVNSNTAADKSGISTDDVTSVVTYVVSGSTSGMATQTETSANIAATAVIPCGSTVDTVIAGTSPSWSLIGYNYNIKISRTCICKNGVRSQLNTTLTGTSGYSAIVISSNDTTSAQISVAGLDAPSSAYVLNETYVRKGTQQSLQNNQHSFSSTVTMTSSNISVDKTSKKITSGTANVQFNGLNADGSTANHTATITFLGNNQATLVVDNGTPKTINW